jgi:hypothetical protein
MFQFIRRNPWLTAFVLAAIIGENAFGNTRAVQSFDPLVSFVTLILVVCGIAEIPFILDQRSARKCSARSR